MTEPIARLASGKAPEAYVLMRILQNHMVPYLPVLDAQGIDAIVRTDEDRIAQLQIKSRGLPIPGEGEGNQIKSLPRGSSPFDFLIIVLPIDESQQELEAWVVPAIDLQACLSPRGDLTMSRRLLRETWDRFHENWELIGKGRL